MKLKVLFLATCLLHTYFSASQNVYRKESPYAMFGDSTKTIDIGNRNISIEIPVYLCDSTVASIILDLQNRIAKLAGNDGTILKCDTLENMQTAHFCTIDSKAEEFYNISPYVYCMSNPIFFLDIDGNRPTAAEAALMAAYAYKDSNQTKYLKELTDLQWKVSSFNTSIQKDYTKFYQNGLQSELFERTINGVTEYSYAFAGTQLYSVEDMIEDVAQIFGIAFQYETAINNAKTLSNELGQNELTFVGHSLGGGEAAASSMATGRAAITFNPAVVSGLTKLRHSLGDASKITNYRAVGNKTGIGNIYLGGDVLNNLQEKIGLKLPGVTIPVPTGIIPTHGIATFLNRKLPEL